MAEEGNAQDKQKELPLGEEVTKELDGIHKVYLKYVEKDATFERKDTVEIVTELVSKVRAALHKIVEAGEEAREKLFWVLFNGSIQLVAYCRVLRETAHSQHAIEGITYAISLVEGNLLLNKAKYLQWRVRLYAELAGAYEDLGATGAARNVVGYGQKQVQYLKELEEQDPPVPESTAVAIAEAERVLGSLDLKYGLQSGQLKPDAWKKKLLEDYQTSQSLVLLCFFDITLSELAIL